MNGRADELEQVDRDLADVAAQLEAGELDEKTAERLRTAYERERSTLVAAGESTGEPGRSRRRMLFGAAILAVGVAVIAWSGIVSLQRNTPQEGATEGIVTDVASGAADLSSVTNEEMEAVIAANPTIVGMRLALAARYVEDGEHGKALDHYLAVLDQDPEQPEALAMVGWLSYLSGEPKLAAPFVAKALSVQPDYPLALWFQANILVATGDRAGARAAIERLLEYDLDPQVRDQAEALLAEVDG
jgi:cytochrome c-type biogenesis protein CcmH/NrfG